MLFANADQPAAECTVDNGHGRVERRTIWVSTALVGYSDLPGLAQVGQVRARITCTKTGEVREQTSSFVTSLTPDQASPRQLLDLHRQHWGIENRLFHVKDDSFGEDRHVLLGRKSGETVSLLRNTALNLLGGSSRLWTPKDYKTARSQYLSAAPLAAFGKEPGS